MYLGLGFVALKCVSFIVLDAGVRTHILEPLHHVIGAAAWYVGKVSPTVFCACFLFDARLCGKQRAVAFWPVLLAATAILTVVVIVRGRFI